MNWNLIVEVLLENVKDNTLRKAIYTDLIQSASYDELEDIDATAFGDDAVFDGVWSEHGEPIIADEYEEEEEEETEGDDDSDWDSQGNTEF
jgi:hypothetical protein